MVFLPFYLNRSILLDRWAFETGILRDFVPQFVGSKCSAVGRLTGI